MILVTNDPLQYLTWSIILVAAIFVVVLVGSIGKVVYRLLRWVTTKPPVSVKSGDCVRLITGEWAKVGSGYDDGTYLVEIPAYSDFRRVERINIKDMRPI